jgi:hypothetical protein
MDPEYTDAAAFAVITEMWEKEFLVSPRYLAGTDGNISPVIEPLDGRGLVPLPRRVRNGPAHRSRSHAMPDLQVQRPTT